MPPKPPTPMGSGPHPQTSHQARAKKTFKAINKCVATALSKSCSSPSGSSATSPGPHSGLLKAALGSRLDATTSQLPKPKPSRTPLSSSTHHPPQSSSQRGSSSRAISSDSNSDAKDKEIAQLKKELARLRASKEAANLAAEESIEPIDKPDGDSSRSGNNPKKPGYDLHTAMELSKAEVDRMKAKMYDFQILCGIPQGAHVTNGKYLDEVSELYRMMIEHFPYLTPKRFPDHWPIREMLVWKLENQHKHNTLKAKKQLEGGTDSEDGEELQAGKKRRRRSSEPKGESEELEGDGGGEEELSAENQDSKGVDDEEITDLIPYYARLGPLLANHLIDGDEYDLPKDWAEYKSDKDQAEWAERDCKIEEDMNKNRDPTDPEWWWETIYERLGDEQKIFSVIWEDVYISFLGYDDDPVPIATSAQKSRKPCKKRQKVGETKTATPPDFPGIEPTKLEKADAAEGMSLAVRLQKGKEREKTP